MTKKLRCAVIGAGKMGANHIRIYSELDHIEFTAIAELNPTLGKEMSDKFKVKLYTDYKQMLKEEKLDIISICVPTSFHYQVAKECITHKINILIEKPIATAVHEAQDLVKSAKKAKIQLLVGHIERFNPAVNKVKELIKNGSLGKIISIIARRVGGFPYQIRDANIMVDLAIHDIDIANYLLDSLPQVVYINKKRINIQQREDYVEYLLKYKFTSAYIQTNWFTPVKIRKLNITGTKGYIEMDYITQSVEFYKSNYDKFKESYMGFSDYILRFSDPEKVDILVEKQEPLKEELKYFIDCVENKKTVDASFAVEALKIALS